MDILDVRGKSQVEIARCEIEDLLDELKIDIESRKNIVLALKDCDERFMISVIYYMLENSSYESSQKKQKEFLKNSNRFFVELLKEENNKYNDKNGISDRLQNIIFLSKRIRPYQIEAIDMIEQFTISSLIPQNLLGEAREIATINKTPVLGEILLDRAAEKVQTQVLNIDRVDMLLEVSDKVGKTGAFNICDMEKTC